MDIRGVDHLNLTVRDLEESARWYGRVFRFAPVERGERDGLRWAILRSEEGKGATMLCLYERPDFAAFDPEALGERGLHGIRHFGFRIEDEAGWRALLEEEGLEHEEMSWPYSTSWYVNDPTGYEIEVACWKGGRIRFGSN